MSPTSPFKRHPHHHRVILLVFVATCHLLLLLLLLSLHHVSAAAGSFRTENIQFTSKAPSGSLTLYGTLFLPSSVSTTSSLFAKERESSSSSSSFSSFSSSLESKEEEKVLQQKFPAVVLVHGSGPQNRNESIQNYVFLNTQAQPEWKKPHCGYTSLNFQTFHEVAQHLASQHDMIVLTYDKRTSANSPQLLDLNVLTLEDLVLDVVHALEYLALNRSRDLWLDVSRLALLGHS
nr:unnamed protein product [Naegleria fowleri]